MLSVAATMPSAMTARVGALFLALGIDWAFAELFRKLELLNLLAEEMLYLLELIDFSLAHESNGDAVAVGTGCTAYTMYIILGVMGNVVVDDDAYVVYVNTSTDDVGCNKHIHLSGLEAVHHIVAFSL